MNDLTNQPRLEINDGQLYINAHNVSVYVGFHRDGDNYMINELTGLWTIDQLMCILTKLKSMERELQS